MGACNSKSAVETSSNPTKIHSNTSPLKNIPVHPNAATDPSNKTTTTAAPPELAPTSDEEELSSMHSVRSVKSHRSAQSMNDMSNHRKNQDTMKRSTSIVGLDDLKEERRIAGALTTNVVHIEVPFGKPIEEVYDGIHDGHVLGSGISGVVRLCTHKKTLVKYAVKCLELGLITKPSALAQLRDEIYIMCQLDHPNIVRLEEVYESHSEIYLVMELCNGGELFDRLDEQPEYHYTEHQCACLVKQMLDAVRYIHTKGIVHRDLKLENFLFSSRDPGSELKMIDFGLSKHFDETDENGGQRLPLTEAVGTPYTVAPEVIRGNYNERCDMWAIGVITYLLLSGDPPFGGCGGPESLVQVRDNILRGDFSFDPPEVWEHVSDDAKDFICAVLVTDPAKRMTACEAQHSQWLRVWTKNGAVAANRLNPNVVKALVTFKEYSDMKKLLCEVLSFTLLPDQIRDLRKEFEKLDKDGSGEITLEALKKMLMQNAGAGSLGALTEEEVEDIFNAMRVRKSETTIQWHEFIAAGLSQCKVDDRNLRLAFDRLDSEHKGYITLENVMDLLGSDGKESEAVRKMYLDGIRDCKHRNGVTPCVTAHCTEITYDDFLMLMKGQPTTDNEVPLVSPIFPIIAHKKSQPIKPLQAVPELTEDETDDISLTSSPTSPHAHPPPTLLIANSRRSIALPEHDHNDKILEKLIQDESKTPLIVNRNLYRAHRQMRLAVLDASKQFEEAQMRRVFKEQTNGNGNKETPKTHKAPPHPMIGGAGLVMKHGETKTLSTEEVRDILKKRQEEQKKDLEKAMSQSGRGKRRRHKTVSDMSAMLEVTQQRGVVGGCVAPGSCPSSPFISERMTMPSPAVNGSGMMIPMMPDISLDSPAVMEPPSISRVMNDRWGGLGMEEKERGGNGGFSVAEFLNQREESYDHVKPLSSIILNVTNSHKPPEHSDTL